MKKIKVEVEVEKKGLFGRKKKVVETKTVEVDDKTYKTWKKVRKDAERREKKAKQQAEKDYQNRPYTIEEMMLYDEIFGD